MRIDSCPIADSTVNAMLPKLQGKGRGLHQLQVRHGRGANSTLVYPRLEAVDFETGQTSYRERLGGHDFVVSASSFFQVNPEQAEKLVALVGEALPERGGVLVDAYAGVGTFAVIYGNRFERVLAIEESATAIADARQNIAGKANVELLAGKVEQILPGLAIAPDVVLVDPSRPGCAPPVLEAILASRPRVVVYVSCNPATLARDLRVLVDGGYELGPVTPVDMFPHTAHIECVTRLTLVE
jgi:23S rRNA (uracil1939-C5)-methyltransferase